MKFKLYFELHLYSYMILMDDMVIVIFWLLLLNFALNFVYIFVGSLTITFNYWSLVCLFFYPASLFSMFAYFCSERGKE